MRQETTEMVRKGRELVTGEGEIWRRSLTPLGGRHREERAAGSGSSSRLPFFLQAAAHSPGHPRKKLPLK